MALGDFEKLESDLVGVFNNVSDSNRTAKNVAEEIAKAVDNYVNSIKLTIPTGSVITQVTGQAVGTPNVSPIEVKKA